MTVVSTVDARRATAPAGVFAASAGVCDVDGRR
jgi:hypothetical protein